MRTFSILYLNFYKGVFTPVTRLQVIEIIYDNLIIQTAGKFGRKENRRQHKWYLKMLLFLTKCVDK